MRNTPKLAFAVLLFATVSIGADPAHDAAKLYRHGVNLGNYFEVPPKGGWESAFELGDLKKMKAEGFDHVRTPVAMLI